MVSIGVVIIDQQAPTVVLPPTALPQVVPGAGPPLVWQHLGAHGLRRRRRAAPLRHGDCGGRLQCGGLGDVVPTTLAWVNLHHDNDQTSYDVSVVDDFNLRSSAGSILACKSGYEAFRIDELCCRNMYNSPRTCRASKYSEFFKRECP
uniref:Uncharacterized protein n=1 Tax=Zea mays TaxID=4577 RepID=A0A804PI95_MAIZE